MAPLPSQRLMSVLAMAAFAISAPSPALFAVEIIAHRGASHDAPENTLAAMNAAWAQEADAIEFDLWFSQDGRVVIFHDADTARFEESPRKIADLTWAQLQELDVGRWKGAEFANERIPALEAVLATVPAGRRAVIEIKCGPEILPALKRILESSGRRASELCIISFNYETLVESKKLLPDVEHYYLHGYKADRETGELPRLDDLIRRARAANADGLNLHFDWPIDATFVKELKDAGLKLFVWTVNDASMARRLRDAGVHGITTDRPQWLREQLRQN
jgi:glycerophosphoryl diester phosphodiesterase